jgi:phospholipid/cholesterol/gamma-HCH transport system substrate-binding protein
MRTLEGSSRLRIGAMSIVITALVVAVGQSFASMPLLFAQPIYYGEFSDSGGLSPGDKVRITGMDVGTVRTLKIQGDHVLVGFTVGDNTIGTESRLAIRTDTLLGRKNLEIAPRGARRLAPGGVIAPDQGTTPYQLYDAFSDVSKAAKGWDIASVKASLNVLSETIDQTYPHLSAALDGVARFSDTIGKRDEQFKHLLANANKVASVLGDRSWQINDLLVNSQTLLAAVNERGRAIDYLLERVSAVSTQFQRLINDNPNLNHVLVQLDSVTNLLVKHKNDLAEVLSTLSRFTASLAEAVGSGPYFKVMVANLLPYQILQPWVDAAFKKRGIDPKEFWRDAGLPGFRFPDPNGQRFPNGAPPPAPRVLEGTPEHPGPGVPPGSPCSYTPPAGGIPTPADPLPCAGLTQGPFGGNPYGANYGPPDVVSSAPNPKAPPSAPGVPAAGIPGQPPPGAPGVPVPLPPGLPGGRTVPVGPLPGPQQATGSQGSSPSPVPGNRLLAPSLAPPDTGGG